MTQGVTIAIVSLLAAAATPQEPYALKGVQLGVTLDQFKALPIPPGALDNGGRPSADCGSMTSVRNCQWVVHQKIGSQTFETQQWTPVGAANAQIIFEFAMADDGNERLAQMKFDMPMVQYVGLSQAYQQRFGSPKVEHADVQNGYGAHFDQETMTWDNGKSLIVFVTRCETPDRFCVRYTDNRLKLLIQKYIDKNVDRAASNL